MDWRYGLCVFSERNADGFVNLQPDWHGDGENDDGGGEALECIHPYGFRSRPRDPQTAPDGKARLGAGLLYVFDGGEGFALPTQDPRHATLLEDEGKGGAQMYAVNDAGAVSRVFLNGATGDVTINRASGPQIAMGASSVQVTNAQSVAQNVALYPNLKTFLESVQGLLEAIVGAPNAVPPVPGLATLLAVVPGGAAVAANLVAQLVIVQAAGVLALDEALSSSASLKASTT